MKLTLKMYHFIVFVVNDIYSYNLRIKVNILHNMFVQYRSSSKHTKSLTLESESKFILLLYSTDWNLLCWS